jgi:hypothetical protein
MPAHASVTLSTVCVCGHTYGDHSARGDHRCLEAHASRAGHACSCVEFTAPYKDGWAPGIHYAPDRTLDAARSGVTLSFERALASIPRTEFSNPGY